MGSKRDVSGFKQGDRIRLRDTVLHIEYRGMLGTVIRAVKSRGVITVEDENGKRYDAYPENVELIEKMEV